MTNRITKKPRTARPTQPADEKRKVQIDLKQFKRNAPIADKSDIGYHLRQIEIKKIIKQSTKIREKIPNTGAGTSEPRIAVKNSTTNTPPH